MANFKKWIIILIIILMITIGILGYIIYQNRGQVIYNIDEEGSEIEYNFDNTLQRVSIRNNYYAVKTCVNKFYIYYWSIFDTGEDYYLEEDDETTLEEQKKLNIEALYSMLDEEYKTYKDITVDNLETKLPEIEEVNVNITDMYVSEKDPNINVYFVYGKLTNTSKNESNDFSMMVKMDMRNETFKVLLSDYIDEKYGDIKEGDNVEINYQENIENDGYNIFGFESITDNTYIADVFKSVRENMINNKQIAYDSLDEEYKAKRFPTFEKFEQYIKDNIYDVVVMKLSQYQKTRYDDYVQYVCLDTHNNYYIINEYAPMKFSVILDTYTIDLPQFLTKYEESDETTKVALNIEKIKNAINDNNFEYVYNKLDDTFKNNNFADYTKLESYLKSYLFEKNTFEYENIEKQGSVYIAKVIIKNKEDANEEPKEMQVVMKLTDTTEYHISFNLEK